MYNLPLPLGKQAFFKSIIPKTFKLKSVGNTDN